MYFIIFAIHLFKTYSSDLELYYIRNSITEFNEYLFDELIQEALEPIYPPKQIDDLPDNVVSLSQYRLKKAN